MNKEPKKRYITDREEEPSYDIRNVFPEVADDVMIMGDISKIMNKEQIKYLIKNNTITELGNNGYVSYIKLQNLFTLNDIKKKIDEICKENKQ